MVVDGLAAGVGGARGVLLKSMVPSDLLMTAHSYSLVNTRAPVGQLSSHC